MTFPCLSSCSVRSFLKTSTRTARSAGSDASTALPTAHSKPTTAAVRNRVRMHGIIAEGIPRKCYAGKREAARQTLDTPLALLPQRCLFRPGCRPHTFDESLRCELDCSCPADEVGKRSSSFVSGQAARSPRVANWNLAGPPGDL